MHFHLRGRSTREQGKTAHAVATGVHDPESRRRSSWRSRLKITTHIPGEPSWHRHRLIPGFPDRGARPALGPGVGAVAVFMRNLHGDHDDDQALRALRPTLRTPRRFPTRPSALHLTASAPASANGNGSSSSPIPTTGSTSAPPSRRGRSAIRTTGATTATTGPGTSSATASGSACVMRTGQMSILQRWTCATCRAACTASRGTRRFRGETAIPGSSRSRRSA